MKLTAKQEQFCQNIVNGMTQADAYRSAYSVKKATNKSVQELASRLMADIKVSSRVEELREKLVKKQLWTREMSVKGLITAYKEGNPSVKVSAIKELNLMHGYNLPPKTTDDEAEPLTITFNVKDAVSEIKVTNAKP